MKKSIKNIFIILLLSLTIFFVYNFLKNINTLYIDKKEYKVLEKNTYSFTTDFIDSYDGQIYVITKTKDFISIIKKLGYEHKIISFNNDSVVLYLDKSEFKDIASNEEIIAFYKTNHEKYRDRGPAIKNQ